MTSIRKAKKIILAMPTMMGKFITPLRLKVSRDIREVSGTPTGHYFTYNWVESYRNINRIRKWAAYAKRIKRNPKYRAFLESLYNRKFKFKHDKH